MNKITNNKNRFKDLKELIKNSYSPYSKFATAAIVHTDKGDFKGVNVENISYGVTICAERNAIFTAITNKAKKFYSLDLLSNSKSIELIPCGACLQVMSEFFGPEANVTVYNIDGKITKYKFKDLMSITIKKRIINTFNK